MDQRCMPTVRRLALRMTSEGRKKLAKENVEILRSDRDTYRRQLKALKLEMTEKAQQLVEERKVKGKMAAGKRQKIADLEEKLQELRSSMRDTTAKFNNADTIFVAAQADLDGMSEGRRQMQAAHAMVSVGKHAQKDGFSAQKLKRAQQATQDHIDRAYERQRLLRENTMELQGEDPHEVAYRNSEMDHRMHRETADFDVGSLTEFGIYIDDAEEAEEDEKAEVEQNGHLVDGDITVQTDTTPQKDGIQSQLALYGV